VILPIVEFDKCPYRRGLADVFARTLGRVSTGEQLRESQIRIRLSGTCQLNLAGSGFVHGHSLGRKTKLPVVSLLGVCLLLLGGISIAGASPDLGERAAAPTQIAVILVDFRITLSRLGVPPGRVVFDVVNKGALAHDLVFAKGGRTPILRPGRKQTIAVAFSKSGVYRFYCSVPGHRALGMQGKLRVGAAKAPTKAV
jgi:plastocyanin